MYAWCKTEERACLSFVFPYDDQREIWLGQRLSHSFPSLPCFPALSPLQGWTRALHLGFSANLMTTPQTTQTSLVVSFVPSIVPATPDTAASRKNSRKTIPNMAVLVVEILLKLWWIQLAFQKIPRYCIHHYSQKYENCPSKCPQLPSLLDCLHDRWAWPRCPPSIWPIIDVHMDKCAGLNLPKSQVYTWANHNATALPQV